MVLFLTVFILWATAHSISASSKFKSQVRRKMGARTYDGTYRLLYNITATITFLPVLVAGDRAIPHQIVWQLDRPVNMLFIALQLLGLAGLTVSLLQTDVLRFAGVGQFVRYLQGRADVNPSPVLITAGAYRIVRHPLYFFSLLVLWFSPVMTLSLLLFNVAATLYFWIGSGYEERRLAAAFGEKYEAYRRSVPRLVPVKIFK
jgi:protein-S-isoprenylcysteine O-methyltransferase Ste14